MKKVSSKDFLDKVMDSYLCVKKRVLYLSRLTFVPAFWLRGSKGLYLEQTGRD